MTNGGKILEQIEMRLRGKDNSMHTVYINVHDSSLSRKWLAALVDVLKKDPYLITDKYNLTQLPCFIDNRHDQSISSIVRKKYGTILLPYWEIEVGRIQPEMQKNYPFSALRLK